MYRDKQPNARIVSQRIGAHDAVFIGWQKTTAGDTFALYNITVAGHPLRGSTVTDKGLLRLHLRIPQTPLRPVT